MAYRVDISLPALTDAEEAYLWVKYHAPESAGQWYEGLMQAVFSLENFPTRCPISAESEFLGVEIRQFIYGKHGNTYRILFSIGDDPTTSEDVVRVWRIWPSSRRQPHVDELKEGAEEIMHEE